MSMKIYWSNNIIINLAFIFTVHEIWEYLSRCWYTANPLNVRLPALLLAEEELQNLSHMDAFSIP